MSLICGSLKWLEDAQERVKRDVSSSLIELEDEIKNTNLGKNWLDEHAALAKIKQKRDKLQAFANKITNMESRVEEITIKANKIALNPSKLDKLKFGRSGQSHNKENQNNNRENEDMDDFDILLDDHDSNEKNINYNEISSDSEAETEQNERYNGIKVRS